MLIVWKWKKFATVKPGNKACPELPRKQNIVTGIRELPKASFKAQDTMSTALMAAESKLALDVSDSIAVRLFVQDRTNIELLRSITESE